MESVEGASQRIRKELLRSAEWGDYKFGVAFIVTFLPAALISSGKWVEKDNSLQVTAVETKSIGIVQIIESTAIL